MLIRSVETFLTRHGMSATQFGRDAADDPRLVSDMRAGRAPRPPLDQRLRGFMAGFELAQTFPTARQTLGRDDNRPHSRPETPYAR